MQNNFWYSMYKNGNFTNFGSNKSYRSIVFCIGFVNLFMASFLYCFPYSYHSSKYKSALNSVSEKQQKYFFPIVFKN